MKRFDAIMAEFERYLQNHSANIMRSFHPSFEVAFWEMVRNGGKRFRPALLFCVVLANDKARIKDAFQIALAIESLHTYSLIHDDLPAMDNASLRRNHPTLHTKYSEADAILCGDGLNTYAFYLIATAHFSGKIRAKLAKSLSFGGLKMVVGQALDCHFEGQKLQRKKVDFIHTNKTAHLIASSLEMGAIIAKLPKFERKKLYDFGLKLGLFFQIRDDILDKISSNEGKSANIDENKNSYVNLLGLKGAEGALDSLKMTLLETLEKIDKKIAKNLYFLLNKYLLKGQK
ncbi:polyprenyl synthetase family protein [Helicobacter sp. 23-1045]